MAAKASEGLTIKGTVPKAMQIAEANQGLSAALPETLSTAIVSKTLAGTIPESLRIAGIGKSITATLPESAFVGPKLSPGLKATLFKSLRAMPADPAWKGTTLAGIKSSGVLEGALSGSLAESLRVGGIGKSLTFKGALPEVLQASIAGKTLAGTIPESLRIAGIGKSITATLPESAFVGPKLSPGLKATLFKSLRAMPADPAWKGTLATTLAGTAPALPQLPGVVSIEDPTTQLPVPTRRRWQTGVLPVTPSRPPEVRPKILHQEVGEVLATGLVRADREEVIFLLTDTGLDDARQHLEAIEERLLTGTGPSFLHAALSASLLLRDLADHLFPPQDEVWTSRFETTHAVAARNVGNRLAAFVDSRLRSQLSPKEHRLFQATLEVVLRWTGEGHHVVSSPREAANAFRQLLEVLAAVARAYRSTGA